MASNLVEKLRGERGVDSMISSCREAADMIERLERLVLAHKLEIARLRELLHIQDFEGLDGEV